VKRPEYLFDFLGMRFAMEWVASPRLILPKEWIRNLHRFAKGGMLCAAQSIGNLPLSLFRGHRTGGLYAHADILSFFF